MRLAAVLLAVLSAVVLTTPARAFYAGGGEVDVVLVIDVSASMNVADPAGARMAAARLLVDLAGDDWRVGLVSFSAAATTHTGLLQMDDPANRTALKNAIAALANSGAATDIDSGLDAAYALLAGSAPARRKAAVLMTDGTGTYTDGIDQYRASGWPVHALGVGPTPGVVVEQIAAFTDGVYYPLGCPYAMSTIVEHASDPDAGGAQSFGADGVINAGQVITREVTVGWAAADLTVCLSWSDPASTLDLALIAPDGTRIDATSADPAVTFVADATHDVCGVDSPALGTWTVEVTGTAPALAGGYERYAVAVFQSWESTARFLPFASDYSPVATLDFGVSIRRAGAAVLGVTPGYRIIRPDGLVEAGVLSDDGAAGSEAPGQTAGDGIYTTSYASVDVAGPYTVEVTAPDGVSVYTLVRRLYAGDPAASVGIDVGGAEPGPGLLTYNALPHMAVPILGLAANINPASIVLKLDGAEVVSNALGNLLPYDPVAGVGYDAVTQVVHYTPPAPLAQGAAHQIELSVNPTASWTFVVGSTAQPAPPPSGGGGGGGGGGCFVATAAYGSAMAEQVDYLRALRDGYLLHSAAGRVFVDVYYEYGPYAAEAIARSDRARALARLALRPLAAVAELACQ